VKHSIPGRELQFGPSDIVVLIKYHRTFNGLQARFPIFNVQVICKAWRQPHKDHRVAWLK
jgi:hypothetical protein